MIREPATGARGIGWSLAAALAAGGLVVVGWMTWPRPALGHESSGDPAATPAAVSGPAAGAGLLEQPLRTAIVVPDPMVGAGSASGAPAAADTGLATLEGLIAAVESGSEAGERFIQVQDTDAVVAMLGVEYGALTADQQQRLAELDADLERREWDLTRDAKLALYRAVSAKIAAGEDDWFPLDTKERATARTAAALERNAHLDSDRIWMSLGGPHDGTSRIVQVFRWDAPDLFEKNAERDAATRARRAALKLELERMGVPLPAQPFSLR